MSKYLAVQLSSGGRSLVLADNIINISKAGGTTDEVIITYNNYITDWTGKATGITIKFSGNFGLGDDSILSTLADLVMEAQTIDAPFLTVPSPLYGVTDENGNPLRMLFINVNKS